MPNSQTAAIEKEKYFWQCWENTENYKNDDFTNECTVRVKRVVAKGEVPHWSDDYIVIESSNGRMYGIIRSSYLKAKLEEGRGLVGSFLKLSKNSNDREKALNAYVLSFLSISDYRKRKRWRKRKRR